MHIDRNFKVGEVDNRLFGSFAEHMGRLVYGGLYQPGSPLSDENGFRRDVIALTREMGVSIVRYPGGNFVSGYRWEDTVGEVSERPARLEGAWKNLEPNTFGLNEFMTWCRAAGTEPMMAINLGTRGAEAAMDILEYCNHPSGTYLSDLRAKHGYKEPHKVKLWCLGNEMDGPWQIGHKSADEYGSLAWQAAKVMKLVDPEIELVACGSAGFRLPTFAKWDETVLEHCYDLADYISVHTYYDNKNNTDADTMAFLANSMYLDEQINSVISVCDSTRAKLKKKKRINLSLDEWNVVYRPHGKPNGEGWTVGPHQLEDIYNMEDVLLLGSMMLSMLRRADRVKIGCIAQLVNVIAPIMTSDKSAWRQTTFYPFSLTAAYSKGCVLHTVTECETYSHTDLGEVPYEDCGAVLDEENGKLAIFAINRDLHNGCELNSDLRQFEGWRLDKHIVINHADLKAKNTEENPGNVLPKLSEASVFEAGHLKGMLEKHSWNLIVLSRD